MESESPRAGLWRRGSEVHCEGRPSLTPSRPTLKASPTARLRLEAILFGRREVAR